MSLPKERPRLRPVDPYRCKHPKLVALFKFKGFNEILYRCIVYGQQLRTSDLEGKQVWQRGRRREG